MTMSGTEGNVCKKCGNPLNFGSKFCQTCGEPVNNDQVVNEQPAYAAQPVSNVQSEYTAQPVNASQPAYTTQPTNTSQPTYAAQPTNTVKPKKKNGCLIAALVTIGIIVLLFGGLIIAAIFNGGEISVSTANVAEAYTASEINEETAKPIDKEDEFPANTDVIYVTAKIKGAPTDTEVMVTWRYTDTEESLDSEIISLEDSTSWVYFSLVNEEGFMPGDYEADILLDGEVEKTLEFTVEE